MHEPARVREQADLAEWQIVRDEIEQIREDHLLGATVKTTALSLIGPVSDPLLQIWTNEIDPPEGGRLLAAVATIKRGESGVDEVRALHMWSEMLEDALLPRLVIHEALHVDPGWSHKNDEGKAACTSQTYGSTTLNYCPTINRDEWSNFCQK